MRVPAPRIGLALVFTALAATAIVLQLEHRRIAPAAVMVETSYAKIVPCLSGCYPHPRHVGCCQAPE